MVTDEERRRVAMNLRTAMPIYDRESTSNVNAWISFWCDMSRSMELDCTSYRAIRSRLADLIDPGEVIEGVTLSADGVGEALPEALDAYDRDDLLNLADEMEVKAANWDVSQDGFPLVHAGYLSAYANCIREALGVDE